MAPVPPLNVMSDANPPLPGGRSMTPVSVPSTMSPLFSVTLLCPVKNKIVINAQDQILWNGAPVDPTQLRAFLDTTQQMNPVPELHLQPDATARYEIVDEVLAVTKKAHVQKMGFVGNEYYMNIF